MRAESFRRSVSFEYNYSDGALLKLLPFTSEYGADHTINRQLDHTNIKEPWLPPFVLDS